MRGYPKHIATRADLMVAMKIDPARTRSLLQRALDGREGWITTGPLKKQAAGTVDDTHRVIDQGNPLDGEQWYQQEWGVLPGNLIDRLGISVADAQAIIAGA